MKVAIVLGVRPNIIKLGPLMKKIQNTSIQQVIINTGQHYDYEMSDIFFNKLKIPKPHYNLEIGSGSLTYQTSEAMKKLEEVFIKEKPDFVIVIGDANPTLVGALTARQLKIPIIHIEAGLRSYDRNMPEEINRVITDHISDYLITPTDYATNNLIKEGISKEKILQFGDLTVEVINENIKEAEKSQILEKYNIKKPYILATIHRAENTNNLNNLKSIMEALDELKVIYPIHPRTKKILKENNLNYKNIKFIPPQGYLDFLKLLNNCDLVISDSGGIQKESVILKKPCIIPRDTYEWKEGVELGISITTGANKQLILEKAKHLLKNKNKFKHMPNPFQSQLSERLIKLIQEY